MSKLFKLKQWLTVPDAAKRLSLDLDEEVTEADVLRLALDGHLALSVRFVNPVTAFAATVIPLNEAPTIEGPDGEKVYAAPTIGDDKALISDDRPTTLTGVYDLPFLGGEQLDVEHRYQALTNGSPVEVFCPHGTFVSGPGGTLLQLYHRGGERDIDFYPASGLPGDAAMVVRRDALLAFEQSIADNRQSIDRPLGTQERRTRLVVIAALCHLSKIKPGSHGEASRIAAATERLGAPVSADTISQIFREIEEAVESRKK